MQVSYRHCRARVGLGLIWATVVLVGLCLLASLAVDYGRVQVVQAQLRSAADAAALAGAQVLVNAPGSVRSVATEIARANYADGSPVILQAEDIELIHWDATNNIWEPAGASKPANAVRVTAYRTAARGDAVDLLFARVAGRQTCDARGISIAMAAPTRYGAVGIDFVKLQGDASSSGAALDNRGSIASNGDITLLGSALVDGDAHPGIGHVVRGANKVNGNTDSITQPLNYPQADPGKAATDNDNASIGALDRGSLTLGSQQMMNLPGGTYYINNLTLGAGATLSFAGPATLYVTGSIDLGGYASIKGNTAAELKLTMVGTGGITFHGNTAIYAGIYAPGTSVTMLSTGDIYGSVIAKSIELTGTAAIHYDMNLRGGVELVQ